MNFKRGAHPLHMTPQDRRQVLHNLQVLPVAQLESVNVPTMVFTLE